MSADSSRGDKNAQPGCGLHAWLVLLLGAGLFVATQLLSGVPRAVVSALPYWLVAIAVFVAVIRVRRAAAKRLTPQIVTAAIAIAAVWPLAIVVWLAVHRGQPPPT